eukprot:COSAG01_NODE_2377_length_7801_cov_4.201117_12_plen_49_part_00
MHYGHGDAITLREYSDWHSSVRSARHSSQHNDAPCPPLTSHSASITLQ